MPKLLVERMGGLAGFGATRSRIRSRGELDTTALSPAENEAIDLLFRHKPAPEAKTTADCFRFQLTRATEQGTETVVVSEAAVPEKVAACVKDEII